MHDRRLATGEGLYAAAERFAFTATRLVALPGARAQTRGATGLAELAVRQGRTRPLRATRANRNLPKSVALTLVEVVERDRPTGTEAVHWRLLTTHEVADAEAAWQIVDWYKMRWTIEQFWRLLETSGAAPRRQSGRNRRTPHQARRHRRQGRGRDHATRSRPAPHPAANPPPSPSAAIRNCRSRQTQRRSRRRDNAAEKSPSQRKASNGPVGSSPSSAAGTATRRPSPRVRSPSNMGWKSSMLSSPDGASEMCASPSAAGRGSG